MDKEKALDYIEAVFGRNLHSVNESWDNKAPIDVHYALHKCYHEDPEEARKLVMEFVGKMREEI